MNALRVIAVAMPTLLLAAGSGARAQVSLPPVQVPNLPRIDTPVDLDRTVGQVADRLDPRVLQSLRITRVRELLRKHRDVIEADPNGAPMRRSEVLAYSPTPQALDAARAAGFTVIRESDLAGLDARIVVLRAPEKMSTRRALKQLRDADPDGTYDFNHIYTESGAAADPADRASPIGAAAADPASPSTQPVAAPAPQAATPETAPAGVIAPPMREQAPVHVGLIDGGVDRQHPTFLSSPAILHGCNGRKIPSAHGTAVASLIVGQADGFKGAAASYTLYLADVYCGEPTGGSVDAVIEALAWMARERVPVVNISLVGPPNAMLERVVRTVLARGHLLVAAVGNDGPAARPLYPAAYAGVIGVTGVDARRRVLVEACRGPHVDLAAPGADMAAAALKAPYATVRGTSFAAPIVAGLLALRLPAPDAAGAAAAVQELTSAAIDLGTRGRDKTYGEGLVGDSVRVDPRLVGAASLSQEHK